MSTGVKNTIKALKNFEKTKSQYEYISLSSVFFYIWKNLFEVFVQ